MRKLKNSEIKVVFLAPVSLKSYENFLELRKLEVGRPTPWVISTAEALVKYANVQLHIITLNPFVAKDQMVKKNGYFIHFLKYPSRFNLLHFYMLDFYKVRKLISQLKPDIVHSHGTERGYSFIASLLKIPYIISLQGLMGIIARTEPYNASYFLNSVLEKYTIRRTENIIAKTSYAAQYALSINPQTKIYNIPNPVNFLFFKKRQRDKEPSVYAPRLLCVALNPRRKGAREILELGKTLIYEFPDLKIVFVGLEGENKKYVASLINDIGLPLETVEVKGIQSQSYIVQELMHATVFLHLSKNDNCPNVVLEAMAMGVPVIATNIGGLPDLINHGRDGFLIDIKDTDSLTSITKSLLLNEHFRKEICKHAKEKALKEFHPEIIAKKLYCAYTNVLYRN